MMARLHLLRITPDTRDTARGVIWTEDGTTPYRLELAHIPAVTIDFARGTVECWATMLEDDKCWVNVTTLEGRYGFIVQAQRVEFPYEEIEDTTADA